MIQTERLGSFFRGFATLASAGLAMTLSNPFDLVRIRMQTMPELIELGLLKSSYNGISDCVSRVLKEEGSIALFKGNGANLLRFYSSETINYLSKESIKSHLNDSSLITRNIFLKNFISGALGSWLTRGILYPIQYARNVLARNTTNVKKTISGCLIQTIKQKGLMELYKGSLISLAGVAIFRGTYFGVFDTLKNEKQSNFERFGLAYISSLLAIMFTYPSDTVRRRLMCSSNNSFKYNGFMDCSYKVYSREGLKSFFRGGPIMFFQSLSASLVLFSYDKIANDIKLAK